jgi:hypothetical protein
MLTTYPAAAREEASHARRWLVVIHHNRRDHPERLLVVMARRLVKRHRSPVGAMSVNALLPLGRPAPGRFPPADMQTLNLILNQKSIQAGCMLHNTGA